MSAKVMNKVMLLGQGWLPLHVVSNSYQTGQVLLDFYVPVPPLQTKHVFVIQELKMLPHYGFSLYHGSTELSIEGVTIASGTTILITFLDSYGVAPTVSYGDMTNKGSGNICDSDPTAGTGQLDFHRRQRSIPDRGFSRPDFGHADRQQ